MPTTNVCASSKSLQSIKDVTPEIAGKVRLVWKHVRNVPDEKLPSWLLELHDQYEREHHSYISYRDFRRWAIDRLIHTHGVEFLGWYKLSGHDVYYCNAGDTYTTTIIFIGNRLIVGCWGDLVERDQIEDIYA